MILIHNQITNVENILKNGQEKTGTLKGPVIESDMIEDEVRLLNGIFVTHIKIKDIVEIKDAF